MYTIFCDFENLQPLITEAEAMYLDFKLVSEKPGLQVYFDNQYQEEELETRLAELGIYYEIER